MAKDELRRAATDLAVTLAAWYSQKRKIVTAGGRIKRDAHGDPVYALPRFGELEASLVGPKLNALLTLLNCEPLHITHETEDECKYRMKRSLSR